MREKKSSKSQCYCDEAVIVIRVLGRCLVVDESEARGDEEKRNLNGIKSKWEMSVKNMIF